MNSPPTGDVEFATYWRDMVGQDYADQRYYNSKAGRFYTRMIGPVSLSNAIHKGIASIRALLQLLSP